MRSAAEAKIASTFLTVRNALPLCVALMEMSHLQPPISIQVDNTTAVGYANNCNKQKATKAIDMYFYRVRDRVSQQQFLGAEKCSANAVIWEFLCSAAERWTFRRSCQASCS